MMKRKKNETETSEKVMKAERRGRAGMLSISARDFAEFAVLYEDSCECNAFSSPLLTMMLMKSSLMLPLSCLVWCWMLFLPGILNP